MNTMNPIKRPWLRAAALALAAALSLSACGQGDATGTAATKEEGHKEEGHKEEGHKEESGHAEEKALTLTAEEAERAGIKAEAAQLQAVSASVVVTASIQPDQDRVARVAPRSEGRIVSAPAKLGDRVRAGQVLASLDSVNVGEAHAALVQAQSELRIAEADFKRAESLVTDEIIPRKDFLRAQADRDKAAAGVRAAADRLRLLGGSPTASGAAVSGFSVTAPFAGAIVEKKATLGDLATPADAMFTIADLSRVWIQADLPEAALAQVAVGAHATVSVPSYPSETFTGRVSYIAPLLNKETRTVAVRIEVANADGRLKPEMFATATIDTVGEKKELLTLPEAAIVLMQGQPTVFVFEHGAYEMRTIEPGERLGRRTVVKAGVKPGEQVVTAGAYELKARKQKSQLGHGH
jgi:cobalt-zinc-cadmium efflux system membrane fusion protein